MADRSAQRPAPYAYALTTAPPSAMGATAATKVLGRQAAIHARKVDMLGLKVSGPKRRETKKPRNAGLFKGAVKAYCC